MVGNGNGCLSLVARVVIVFRKLSLNFLMILSSCCCIFVFASAVEEEVARELALLKSRSKHVAELESNYQTLTKSIAEKVSCYTKNIF